MPEVTLIREINVYERPGLRDRLEMVIRRWTLHLRMAQSIPGFERYSVWICSGRLADDEDYSCHAVRLIGPTSRQEADHLLKHLKLAFEKTGTQVHEETVADD